MGHEGVVVVVGGSHKSGESRALMRQDNEEEEGGGRTPSLALLRRELTPRRTDPHWAVMTR